MVASLGVAVICGTLGVAKAETIAQTRTVASTLTDWNENLTFDKFNSSLGTLESITFTITTTAQTVITVTNTALSSSNGTVRTEVQISLLDPEGYFSDSLPQIDGFVPGVAVNYTLASGESKAYGPYTRTLNTGGGFTYDSPDVLAEFTGSSTDDIVLALSTFTQTLLGNNGGNTSASQVTSASGSVTLTYSYSAVPEPSTMALGAIGVFAMIALYFRRRTA